MEDADIQKAEEVLLNDSNELSEEQFKRLAETFSKLSKSSHKKFIKTLKLYRKMNKILRRK